MPLDTPLPWIVIIVQYPFYMWKKVGKRRRRSVLFKECYNFGVSHGKRI